jgi:asparagine synthetase B (glutamine-hydrolysing)
MCGIVGMFGTLTPSMYKLFKVMLNVDIVRGKDSTGVAHATHHGVSIVKDTVFPYELLDSHEYNRHIGPQVNHAILNRVPQALIGHNRAATIGSVTCVNAHPFKHGNITLVHNGTLKYHIKTDKKFETDSESICYSVDKDGVAKMYKDLDGAASLVWWNSSNQSINLLSNGKRPLCFIVSKDKKSIVFASEGWLILDAAKRMNMKFMTDHVWTPKEDLHFQFTLDHAGRIAEKTTKLAPFVYSYTGYTYYGGANNNKPTFQSYYADNWKDKDKDKDAKQIDILPPNTTQTKLVGSYPHISKFFPKTCTEKEFEERYTDCFFCSAPLKGTHKESIVIDEKVAACMSCTAVAELNQIDLTAALY